jgi:hypothetical protein
MRRIPRLAGFDQLQVLSDDPVDALATDAPN